MTHQRTTKKEQNRFNRYMVECEFNRKITAIKQIERFNRYMVECEFINTSFVILYNKF